MTLRKLGKNWYIDYRANGKRYRQSTNTANKAEALAFMRQIDVARKMPSFEAAVEVLRHFYAKPVETGTPLASLWPLYEDVAKSIGRASLAGSGWTKRRANVRRFLAWLSDRRATITTIEQINGQIAAAYASHLAAQKLSTKTRANTISELGTVWRILSKAVPDVTNPWSDLVPRDTDGKRGKAFSPAEAASVLAAAKTVGKYWYEVCEIMRHTGLRYGDVANLRWADIDGDVIRLSPSKTSRHQIKVALPIVADLAAIIATIPRTSDFVFPLHSHLYGKTGHGAYDVLNFRSVLEAAGLADKGYTIHSWRHTVATRLADAGVSAETRKRILGHRTDLMAERYDHAEHLDEISDALEAAAEKPQ